MKLTIFLLIKGLISIVEHVGRNNETVFSGVRCLAYYLNNERTNFLNINDPYDSFHIYTLDWNADRIKFMVDNVIFNTYNKHMDPNQTWPFDDDFNIILNLGKF